jgi:hypothetical protein
MCLSIIRACLMGLGVRVWSSRCEARIPKEVDGGICALKHGGLVEEKCTKYIAGCGTAIVAMVR